MKIVCTVEEFAEIVRGCHDTRRTGACNDGKCPLYQVCCWSEGEIEQFITAADVIDKKEDAHEV